MAPPVLLPPGDKVSAILDQNDHDSASIDTAHEVIVISIKNNNIGALIETLQGLERNSIPLENIVSRRSLTAKDEIEVRIEVPHQNHHLEINDLVKRLGERKISVSLNTEEPAIWFPRCKKDLDGFAERILEGGAELQADHPGFMDEVYKKRRNIFADSAKEHKHGNAIARFEYTDQEKATWKTCYNGLTKLFKTNACHEFLVAFGKLQENVGYSEDNIPQLQDISEYLKGQTGFTLRPVAGLLSPRDFLAGLAHCVFHSTQYIRHHSNPEYTPEPDIVHELLGHVPMFADPNFARFSQDLGLASLGATDQKIQELSTLYWFTVEFGLCMQNGEKKAYGAGLLSSFGELKYCVSDEPEFRPFDPYTCAVTEYPITKMQPIYFVSESFTSAKEKLREWTSTIVRPFHVHYDPLTETIQVMDKETVKEVVDKIGNDLNDVVEAVRKL